MKRMLLLILLGAFTCGVLSAQDVPRVVTSQLNCPVKSTVYEDWYQKTRLSEGEPYVE